jgi:NAD(P)-dependent dehydrogenase (short-subunit alcohol dehydrogenase family)
MTEIAQGDAASAADALASERDVPSYPDLLRLDGRTVVVIGAGQGMGRQTAHALSSVGATVVCVDVKPDLASAVAGEIGGLACVADATTAAGMDAIAEAARGTGTPLHGLVDIIGMARWARIQNISDEDYDWAIDVNYKHAFLVVRTFAPMLGDLGGGSLVFIASISGSSSAPYHAVYGSAKAGLLSLVRTAAVEFGPRGVRVNAVSPGTTATPRVLANGQRSQDGTSPRAIEPLGHVGRTADIAAAALFMTSPLAGHITGQNLTVDGGAMCVYPIPLTDPGA